MIDYAHGPYSSAIGWKCFFTVTINTSTRKKGGRHAEFIHHT